MANLVTDASNLSFSGSLDGQAVSGYVDPGASGFYDVYYTFGSEKPRRFNVYNPDGTPSVTGEQECDCVGSADIGCKTNHCNAGSTCPDLGTGTCQWKAVSS